MKLFPGIKGGLSMFTETLSQTLRLVNNRGRNPVSVFDFHRHRHTPIPMLSQSPVTPRGTKARQTPNKSIPLCGPRLAPKAAVISSILHTCICSHFLLWLSGLYHASLKAAWTFLIAESMEENSLSKVSLGDEFNGKWSEDEEQNQIFLVSLNL